MIRKFIFCIVLVSLLVSCGSDKNQVTNNVDRESLPPSGGGMGEVLLVIDTSHLQMELGKALEEVFLDPFPALPQPELPFSLTRINFVAFTNLFKRHKTILFAVPFNDGASKGYMNRILGNDVVEKIKENKKEMYVKEDVFAQGQQMIFIFGNKQKEVANILVENKEKIKTLINNRESKRLLKAIYKVGEKKGITTDLKESFGYKIRVPKDYRLAKKGMQFTWLRLAKEETDYNVIISRRPYTSEEQFDSNYVAKWRQQVNSNVNGGDTSSTKVLQTVYKIENKIISNPGYTLESRGLWKLKDNTMGGPFVSQIKVSEDRKSIYYIEGFIMAPGKNKRELVREIETVMSTFRG